MAVDSLKIKDCEIWKRIWIPLNIIIIIIILILIVNYCGGNIYLPSVGWVLRPKPNISLLPALQQQHVTIIYIYNILF